MSEKYGIQSVLKESIAQTPVSLSTVLVVIASSQDGDHEMLIKPLALRI